MVATIMANELTIMKKAFISEKRVPILELF